MFLLNSRLASFVVGSDLHRSHDISNKLRRANLPSSLRIVLPIAFVYSTRPPVSVLVRLNCAPLRGFSWKQKITFLRKLAFASFAYVITARLCTPISLRYRDNPNKKLDWIRIYHYPLPHCLNYVQFYMNVAKLFPLRPPLKF